MTYKIQIDSPTDLFKCAEAMAQAANGDAIELTGEYAEVVRQHLSDQARELGKDVTVAT